MTQTPPPPGAWWRELTRYQWLVLIVAWLGWVFDVMDAALFNFAKGPMMTEFLGGAKRYAAEGPQIEGWIQAIFILGWALGGLIFGTLADRWGRTRTLVATILIYTALTSLTAACQSWQQVAVIRFLTAIGIGGEWAAGAALIAEVVPNRARSGAAAALQTAAAFGPILAALANQSLSHVSWRYLFIVGLIPAALTLLIRWKVREPERWTEARKSSPDDWRAPLRTIFGHPTWRRNALVAAMIGLAGIAGAGTVTYWLPNLVKEASSAIADPAIIRERTSIVTYLGHLGTLLGVVFFPWLCDKMGRRGAFLLFFLLTPLALLLSLTQGGTYESLLYKAPILFFLAIGLSAGFGLYFPELFPTSARATGAGFAYNVARIGQAPLPILTGWVAQSAHSAAFGVLLSGGVYLLGLVALPFAPETKGRPLPDDP